MDPNTKTAPAERGAPAHLGRMLGQPCAGWMPPGLPAVGLLCRKRSQNVYPLGTLVLMKDSGLRIRVERELRERFLEICRQKDRPAAQVIREFMRDYIADAEAQNENKDTDGTRRRN